MEGPLPGRGPSSSHGSVDPFVHRFVRWQIGLP